VITILIVITVINGYNLVDGIDGLAAGIGLLASLVFGMVFHRAGLQNWTLFCAVVFGSVAGFTWYNVFSRGRKIYMGDTGTLTIGFILAVMVLRYLNLNSPAFFGSVIQTPVAFILSLLIVPVFDVFRIIILRILQGRSPFRPDRQHIHHRLVDTGLNHLQATGILLAVTLGMLGLTILLQGLREAILIVILIGMAALLSFLPGYLHKKKENQDL
jgi:UDP-N-acetylmuramyl pentapeptide phosphotransferase/UDP-N-acetylglucosamine-1-phosphate transferase